MNNFGKVVEGRSFREGEEKVMERWNACVRENMLENKRSKNERVGEKRRAEVKEYEKFD